MPRRHRTYWTDAAILGVVALVIACAFFLIGAR